MLHLSHMPDMTEDGQTHWWNRLPGDTFGVESSQLAPEGPPLIVEPAGQRLP